MSGVIQARQPMVAPIMRGSGAPAVDAPLGYLYEDSSGGAVWVKTSAGPSGWTRVGSGSEANVASLVGAEDISAYDVVTATGYVADSTNPFHKNIVMGVARESILTGFSGEVVLEGYIQNVGWSWAKGDVLYLNGKVLSVTPPTSGFRAIIGVALSATEINVNISESILL